MLYPQIQASELSKVTPSVDLQASEDNTLKLVPSGSAKITTTIPSKRPKDRRKGRVSPDWPGHTTLRSTDEEYTSTFSLVDRIGSVSRTFALLWKNEMGRRREGQDVIQQNNSRANT
jgi:hypothetical protein